MGLWNIVNNIVVIMYDASWALEILEEHFVNLKPVQNDIESKL